MRDANSNIYRENLIMNCGKKLVPLEYFICN